MRIENPPPRILIRAGVVLLLGFLGMVLLAIFSKPLPNPDRKFYAQSWLRSCGWSVGIYYDERGHLPHSLEDLYSAGILIRIKDDQEPYVSQTQYCVLDAKHFMLWHPGVNGSTKITSGSLRRNIDDLKRLQDRLDRDDVVLVYSVEGKEEPRAKVQVDMTQSNYQSNKSQH